MTPDQQTAAADLLEQTRALERAILTMQRSSDPQMSSCYVHQALAALLSGVERAEEAGLLDTDEVSSLMVEHL